MILKRLTISILATLGLLLATVSCVNDSFGECPDAPAEEDAKMVNLTFSVIAPSAADPTTSRAQDGSIITTPDEDNYFETSSFDKELAKYELIHTLRVIIVRGTGADENIGVIEHNKLFTLSEAGVVYYDDMRFLVRGNEQKRIFIVANENKSILENQNGTLVPFDFSTLAEGTKYNEELSQLLINSAGNRIYIDNRGDNDPVYIPMCEEHSVMVKEPLHPEDYDQRVESPLFITRSAVKFSFNFTSDYGDGIYVTDITVDGLADTEYFMPKATYVPAKEQAAIGNWTGANEPDLTGRFITEFATPLNAIANPFKFTFSDPIELGMGKTTAFEPPVYFLETKRAGGFTATISIASMDEKGALTTPYTFDAKVLPNLPILPRNTHVKVNVNLSGTDLQATVELVPYIGVNLRPSFGF